MTRVEAGRAGHVYPEPLDYSAHDSPCPRFHVNKESESASLLIASAGRDKLSPLMKSFHRLHTGLSKKQPAHKTTAASAVVRKRRRRLDCKTITAREMKL